MAKPSLPSLRKVLTDQDWHWAPYFTITPLKLAEIERVVSQYYSAVDEHIDGIEKGSLDEQGSLHTKQCWDTWKQHARNALMTHTHAGTRQPFGVRHRRLLENLGVIGLFRKSSNLYYFAIAWQFGEWRDHVLEVCHDTQHGRIKSQYQEASERIQGTAASAESKDALRDAVSVHLLGEEIDLLEDQLDSLMDGEKEECHHRELLLDVWLDLHGIPLDVSGKNDVIGWTFNRYGNNILPPEAAEFEG